MRNYDSAHESSQSRFCARVCPFALKFCSCCEVHDQSVSVVQPCCDRRWRLKLSLRVKEALPSRAYLQPAYTQQSRSVAAFGCRAATCRPTSFLYCRRWLHSPTGQGKGGSCCRWCLLRVECQKVPMHPRETFRCAGVTYLSLCRLSKTLGHRAQRKPAESLDGPATGVVGSGRPGKLASFGNGSNGRDCEELSSSWC